MNPPSEPPSATPRRPARGLNLAALAATGLEGSDGPPTPEIPGFEIQSLIGSGGLGLVWKAVRTVDGQIVALKIPRLPELDLALRLEEEGALLRSLNHGNIVQHLDQGLLPDGRPWLALEFVDGAPLSVLIPEKGFSWNEGLSFFRRIAAGVMHAHACGVLHRDLKPGNILIGHDGSLKVADFGLARKLEERVVSFSLTLSGQVSGTAEYLAPECYTAGTESTAAADQYALAVILYELLAGHPPRGSWQALSCRKTIDVRVDDVIRRALHPNPAERYPSVQAMVDDLEIISRTPARYSGAPRVTLAIRIMDTLWTALGIFVFLAAFGVESKVEVWDVRPPIDLIGDGAPKVGAFMSLTLLLILMVPLCVWQLVRLWYFRSIPLREALPAPPGVNASSGKTAAVLIMLNQVFCLLAPAWLMSMILRDGCSAWLDKSTPPWLAGLVLTDGYRGRQSFSVWDWPKPGVEYSLRQREGWITDNLGRDIDHTTFYPGYTPRIMAAGAILTGATIAITLLSGVWRWGRIRNWRNVAALIPLTAAAAGIVRAEAAFNSHATQFDNRSHHNPGAWFSVRFDKLERLLDQMFPGPPPAWIDPPPQFKDCYSDRVITGASETVSREHCLRGLADAAATARTEHRCTELLYKAHESMNGGRDFRSFRLYLETSGKPGESGAGHYLLTAIYGRTNDQSGVTIISQDMVRYPLWKAEARELTTAEARDWTSRLMAAVREDNDPAEAAAGLFIPHPVSPDTDFDQQQNPAIHPKGAAACLSRIRKAIRAGADPRLADNPSPAEAGGGGIRKVRLQLTDRGGPAVWTCDLVFVSGRWLCARLTFR